MRILSLSLKNLNSLQGEWHIDFRHPAYSENGIFAITGQTGAGKSTILDAICLALYGQTPRLEDINSASNEIMSRNTAECWAKVIFSVKNKTYLCEWSQQRAYKKPEGKLQPHSHAISYYEEDEIGNNKEKIIKGGRKMKEQFLELLKKVKREGIDELIQFLEKSDLQFILQEFRN